MTDIDVEGVAKAMIAALDDEQNPIQNFQTIDSHTSFT
jgi:hypothetical protein